MGRTPTPDWSLFYTRQRPPPIRSTQRRQKQTCHPPLSQAFCQKCEGLHSQGHLLSLVAWLAGGCRLRSRLDIRLGAPSVDRPSEDLATPSFFWVDCTVHSSASTWHCRRRSWWWSQCQSVSLGSTQWSGSLHSLRTVSQGGSQGIQMRTCSSFQGAKSLLVRGLLDLRLSWQILTCNRADLLRRSVPVVTRVGVDMCTWGPF